MENQPFISEYRIYYEDTDAEGVVFFANYLKFFERARSDWLRHMGYPVEKMVKDIAVFMVKRVEIEYISPATLGEVLRIETTVLEQRKTQFTLQQNAYNDSGTVCESVVQVVTVNLARKKPTKIPQEILVALEKWQKK